MCAGIVHNEIHREDGSAMSRALTEQFIKLLLNNDLIKWATIQADGRTRVYAHYPTGSKLRVNAVASNLIDLELEENKTIARNSLNILDALEYVKRWSLDLEHGGVFVKSMDELHETARNLLKGLGSLDEVDASAVDVKMFAAYISYPRVGSYFVHGMLVKLPDDYSELQKIIRECSHEEN